MRCEASRGPVRHPAPPPAARLLLPFVSSGAAESDSIGSCATLPDRCVQDDCLALAKPDAFHVSRALAVAVGLRVLAAEERRGRVLAEQLKSEQGLSNLRLDVDSGRPLSRPCNE